MRCSAVSAKHETIIASVTKNSVRKVPPLFTAVGPFFIYRKKKVPTKSKLTKPFSARFQA